MALDEEFPEDSVVGQMLRANRKQAAKKAAATPKPKPKAQPGLTTLVEPATDVLTRRMREQGLE
jgi:hypothetical protein